MAHVFFQQGKYQDAIRYYAPMVERHLEAERAGAGTVAGEGLLSVQAILVANLCVSYIMTSQN